MAVIYNSLEIVLYRDLLISLSFPTLFLPACTETYMPHFLFHKDLQAVSKFLIGTLVVPSGRQRLGL